MKKILKIFLLVFILSGCKNLDYNTKKDFSIIENQIKNGDIIVEGNKIFYKDEFDIFINKEEERELLNEYANKNGLIVTPIK